MKEKILELKSKYEQPYEQYKNLLEVDKCVAVRGKISYRNNEPSLLVEAIKEL